MKYSVWKLLLNEVFIMFSLLGDSGALSPFQNCCQFVVSVAFHSYCICIWSFEICYMLLKEMITKVGVWVSSLLWGAKFQYRFKAFDSFWRNESNGFRFWKLFWKVVHYSDIWCFHNVRVMHKPQRELFQLVTGNLILHNFVDVLIWCVYWPEIFCLKALVLSAHMYVLVFQD